MLDGLEWNVRLSRTDAHDVLEKFRATFENYWNDGEFEDYDPSRDAERFDQAVRAERAGEGVAAALMARLDVHPWDF